MQPGSEPTTANADGLTLPPTMSEDVQSQLAGYEQRIAELTAQLAEEEARHSQLLAERDSKIAELEHVSRSPVNASTPSESASPLGAATPPAECKSKVKILEQRIVEMTLSLDEKDRQIFELECEIDRVKVELNQVRVEAARVPELEATINELDNTIAGLKEAVVVATEPPTVVENVSGVQEDSMTSSDDSATQSSGESVTADPALRVAELEGVVITLTGLVEQLQAAAPVDTLVGDISGVEDSLRTRIAELEEQLEISEMNRQILKQNFALENEEKMKAIHRLDSIKGDMSDEEVDRVMSAADPVDTPTEEVDGIDGVQHDVIVDDRGIPVVEDGLVETTPPPTADAVEAAPTPAPVQYVQAAPAPIELQLPTGETLVVTEAAAEYVKSQWEQIEALTTEIQYLKLAGKDSTTSTPEDPIHPEIQRSSPRPSPVSAKCGGGGCFGTMFKRN